MVEMEVALYNKFLEHYKDPDEALKHTQSLLLNFMISSNMSSGGKDE
jgi:hypothetical protein